MVSFKRGGGANFLAARNQLFPTQSAGSWFWFTNTDARPNIQLKDVVNYEIYNPRKGKMYRVSVSCLNLTRNTGPFGNGPYTGTGTGTISIEILD